MGDELAGLVASLRRLHRDAGEPSTHALAKSTGYSHTTIARALRGTHRPTWPVVNALVAALGGDPATFRREWVDVRDAEDPLPVRVPDVPGLAGRTVREVMVPRTEVVWIESGKTVKQALTLCLRAGYSRLPVIDHDIDRIIGTVHLRDLARALMSEDTGTIAGRTTPARFVPDSKRLDELLAEMRLSRNHMAIVADEYGGTAGIVTLEDILEQLVGPIVDESDNLDPPPVERLVDGSIRVNARLPVAELGRVLGVPLTDTGVATAGGLVGQLAGRVAEPGVEVALGGLRLRAEGRRDHFGKARVTSVLVLGPVGSANGDLPRE